MSVQRAVDLGADPQTPAGADPVSTGDQTASRDDTKSASPTPASTSEISQTTERNQLRKQLSELRAQFESLQARLDGANEAVDQTSEIGSVTVDELMAQKSPKKNDVAVQLAAIEAVATAMAPTTAETAKALMPELRRVTWTDFKNSSLEEREVYAIEVLMGPAKFYWQKHREERSMKRRQVESNAAPNPTGPESPLPSSAMYHSNTVQDEKDLVESQVEMPERIRINSEPLLMILREVTESVWSIEPTVFLRPYKLLVRHESAIRGFLHDLEAKWSANPREAGRQQGQTGTATVQNGTIDGSSQKSPPNIESATAVEVTESYEALQSLRCLVSFMDTDVLPVHRNIRSGASERITFRDLWHVYRPGDVVVSWRDLDNKRSATEGIAVAEADSSDQISGKTAPTIWKVLQVSKGRPVLGAPHSADKDERPRPPSQKINKFTILCYMIGYNGTTFGPVDHAFEISSFDGKRLINSFDPCPAAYVDSYEQIRARLTDRGIKFVQYKKSTHCHYIGPALLNHPAGIQCKPAQNDKVALIDGHVIVDFKEAQREDPKWVIRHGLPEASGGSGLESVEDYPKYIWKDQSRSELHKTVSESIYDDNHLDAADMDDFIANDTFLSAVKYPLSEDEIDGRTFGAMEYALLPDRVVGFDLHRRKYSILALDHLQPVQTRKEGWADLKLPRGHKHMVQAQIKTHFMEKRSREHSRGERVDSDIIHGKGQGLIILLHGAPGVGKTSTAECVAESLRKPLYPITCGDLGVTASVVEQTLTSTFAKAEAWDCVLLLDEADVFLAQRTRADLKRNAIVSVFLRVLEYYKGILILTTNRVGAFDEAFKSRIHLHLYYPMLNKDQTLAIWKMNLERVVHRKQGNLVVDEAEILQFAEHHFEYHKAGNTRWNGRQIRNAYQTALAMAEYEALEELHGDTDWEMTAVEQSVKAHLRVSHFRTVADASSHFDSYIEETIGTTDAGRAFTDRDRADHFRWMPPADNRSQRYSGESNRWPHDGQGGGGSYGQPKPNPNPFSQPSEHQSGRFTGFEDFAPVQKPQQYGTNWGGMSRSWNTMEARGSSTNDPESFMDRSARAENPYFAHKDMDRE